MPSGRLAARRRGVAEDSDSESEDGYPSTNTRAFMSEEEKRIERLKQMSLADLGSIRRDETTASDYRGPRHANVKVIFAARDCNQEGTEASERVAKHKGPLAQWSNFGNTDVAKRDAGEVLRDIAGGQIHRLETKKRLAAEAEALGRPVSIEDTYEDRRRPAGIPPARVSRGGSHAAANDRGNFSRGRGGGGNMGRGPTRAAAPASSSGSRPLDPAVDPDREYGYKDKSSRSKASKKSTTTMVNNTVRVMPSAPAAMVKGKAAKDKSPFLKPLPSAPTATRKMLSMPSQNNTAGPSSRSSAIFPRHPAPRLADSNDFMAAALNMFGRGKNAPVPAQASSSTSAAPASSATGLLASKFAPSAASAAAKESIAPIQRLDRAEFRDPDLSPAELTDALPSTGQLSMTSPSVQSDTVINNALGVVGLGISLTGDGKSPTFKRDPPNKTPLQDNPDLMDIEIPEVKKDVLLPSPARKASAEEIVSISKAELEKWNIIKALMQAGDTTGLMNHLTLEASAQPKHAPVPTHASSAATQAQPIKVSFPNRSIGGPDPKQTAETLGSAPSTKDTGPVQAAQGTVSVDSIKVANGYSVNSTKIDSIIGDKKNWPKGVATQTTPSLAASRWAPGPKFAVPIPQKPIDQNVSSKPKAADGERATSPITISSTSSSSYHSSVEHIMTQPVMQNIESKPSMPQAFGQTSAPTAPAAPKAKSKVNPFAPRDPIVIEDDVVLDYGEPVNVKPISKSAASSTKTPAAPARASKSTAKDLAAQRESMKADMIDQLGLTAALQEKSGPAHTGKGLNGRAHLEEQKTSSLSASEAPKVPAAGRRPILTPKAPSSTAALRSDPVRAGLTGSKWATAQPPSATNAVAISSSSTTSQPIPLVKPVTTTKPALVRQPPPSKPALTTSSTVTAPLRFLVESPSTAPKGATGQPVSPLTYSLTTGQLGTAQKTSAVNRPVTTSVGAMGRPGHLVKSGLTNSKWATTQPTSPVKSGSTLRERSPNKSSQIEKGFASTKTNGTSAKSPKKPDSPIFGDAKLVSKLPKTASSMSSTAHENYPPPRKYTAIKHTAPGPGYEWLMRDMAAMKLWSGSTQAAPKSAETNSALATAKGIAQQFGVDEGDSDESEL